MSMGNSPRKREAMWEDRYQELREQVRLTLEENMRLADGDDCTLKRLKDAIGYDENTHTMSP